MARNADIGLVSITRVPPCHSADAGVLKPPMVDNAIMHSVGPRVIGSSARPRRHIDSMRPTVCPMTFGLPVVPDDVYMRIRSSGFSNAPAGSCGVASRCDSLNHAAEI